MKPVRLRFKNGFAVVMGNKRSQAATMVIPVGGREGDANNNHQGADQWLFVVSGKGSATIAGKKVALTPYDAVAATRAKLQVIGVLCGGFSKKDLLANGCRAVYGDPAELLANLSEILGGVASKV